MVIEAGVVTGYVIAWAVRKVRRVGGQLDAEIDEAVDAGMQRLHTVVAAKLGADPVLADVATEAADDGQVSDLTRQRVQLALTAAALKDDDFGHEVTALLSRLRATETAIGTCVVSGGGSAVFTGDANVQASGIGVAFGQVGRDVNLCGDRGDGTRPDPTKPGQSRP